MTVSGIALGVLWPDERDAGAIRAAQEDPAVLADLQLNSALRNDPAVIAGNIEAALAANDADLANSFVELAGERNISLGEDLSRRGGDALPDRPYSSPFCKHFSPRLPPLARP